MSFGNPHGFLAPAIHAFSEKVAAFDGVRDCIVSGIGIVSVAGNALRSVSPVFCARGDYTAAQASAMIDRALGGGSEFAQQEGFVGVGVTFRVAGIGEISIGCEGTVTYVDVCEMDPDEMDLYWLMVSGKAGPPNPGASGLSCQ